MRRWYACARWIGLVSVFLVGCLAGANAAPLPSAGIGPRALGDAEELVDNTQLDLQDIIRAPLHVASDESVLRSPRFYLALAGVGAVWGGAFALDQTFRSRLHTMSANDADLLQNLAYGSIGAGAAALYAYGLVADDTPVRQDMLTAGEGAAVASLVNVGIKAAFGRLRPYQDGHSHTAFFRGGVSFASGDVTPLFGLAAGISESFNNAWYVAAPAYSLALLDGFGRMGHDAHWFSDVVGAGLLGWGTTELFFYLHRQHQDEPGRWRVFPLAPTSDAGVPAGVAVAYTW